MQSCFDNVQQSISASDMPVKTGFWGSEGWDTAKAQCLAIEVAKRCVHLLVL